MTANIWSPDRDHYIDGLVDNVDQFVSVPLTASKSLKSVFPSGTVLTIRSEIELTDYFETGPFCVVSERLRRLLEGFDVSAEFYRLTLSSRTQSHLAQSYYCMNTLRGINCFDWVKATYTLKKSFAIAIKRLVLDLTLVKDELLFRVERTIPSILCANQMLAEAIRAEKFTGVNFQDPIDWRDPACPPYQ